MLTKEQVQSALPAKLKSAATQEFTDKLNNIVSDPIVAEQVRDNFIGYAHVLRDGRFKTEDYLLAVTYVSFKLMGLTNLDAYQKTFPGRYQNLIQKGTSSSDIATYVSAYHRNKLVGMILEQSLVPSWILNQDMYQKALNHQAHLMINAKSEKVQSDAANSILTHLKKPEVKEFQISLETKENSGMKELQEGLRKLAETQRQMIEAGVPTVQIAGQRLIEAEYVEITPEDDGDDVP